MSKSMEWYVENNDFEGALERFESTNARWKGAWFETCEQIFNKCKEWAKTYIINPLEKTIKRIVKIQTKRKTKYSESIQILDGVDLLDNAKEKCYLFEFLNDNDEMVCSKVGTTTRKVLQRLKEELNSDTYKKLGCVRAVVQRVYDCGEIPAEGLESYFRAMYIKKYPQSFKKNDRFMGQFFDLTEADKIVAQYFAQELIFQLLLCILHKIYFCAICLLTTPPDVWYNGGPKTLAPGRIIHYNTSPQICQEKNRKKIFYLFFPKLLTNTRLSDIIIIVKGESNVDSGENNKKILKYPLTN